MISFLPANGDAYNCRWDTHVLTGSLKLFFRELQHPLLPWAAFLLAAEILKLSGAAENPHAASKIRKILNDKVYQ